MRHKIKEHKLNWAVASAGTDSYHVGSAPHRFSQNVCRANGIDISEQVARRFEAIDFDRYDKVYAMAADVYREIERIAKNKVNYSKLEYFLNELETGKNDSVPDPWYGEEEGYKPVYDLIERTCDAIIKKYK